MTWCEVSFPLYGPTPAGVGMNLKKSLKVSWSDSGTMVTDNVNTTSFPQERLHDIGENWTKGQQMVKF